MSFGREKRVLLGFLALLAPLPLPFNDIVDWPALLVFWAAGALFLRRAWHDAGGWLPNWAMNLLAIGYLPILFLDLTTLWRGRFLHPIVHLLLFVLAVKLFALKSERDKWHVVLLIFFVFLAAVGTSVHPSVVFYVVAFLAGSLWMLTRFTGWEMLGRHPRRAPAGREIPLRGFVAGSTLFAIVAAVPLFVSMPRLRSPYVIGPGGGYGSLTQVASFQDVMRLDGIGRVRGSRAVVMRLTYETPPPPTHSARIKVMTYDRFEDDEWSRSRRDLVRGRQRVMRRLRDGSFALAKSEATSWMSVWMHPFGGYNLGVPVDAVRLDWTPTAMEGFVLGRGSSLILDDGGAVSLPIARPGMVRYRVGLGGGRGAGTSRPLLAPDPEMLLGESGISPRLAALAAEVMGEGSALVRAQRAQQHLIEGYEYTLDFLGAPPGSLVESFLFEQKRGHCELFATAMVLMLRSQGIPARLATGFLGADFNPIEDYFIVRESNAHAWVEAYIEGAGRQLFDPTPPAGRPTPAEIGLTQLAYQLYDFVIFRWDRHILTYGLADQVGVVSNLRDLWQTVARWFGSDGDPPAVAAAPEQVAPAESSSDGETPPDNAPWWPLAAMLTLAIAGFLLARRQRFTATRAYVRLREQLRPEVGDGLEALAPLAVIRRFERRFPETAAPARELVALYLAESFAARKLSEIEIQRAKTLLRQALGRRAA